MCRLASIAKVTDKNRDLAWAFMIALGDAMSPGNDDGLGYAAFDKSGNLFGERWLINKTSFTDFSTIKNLTPMKIEQIYNFFGDKVVRNEAQAIILHTRAATCGRGILNTHPFVNDWDKPTIATIHNGMIANHEELDKKYSTCDSEVLVHLYEKFKVGAKLENMKELVKELMGWYTVMNLTKTPEDRMVLDIYTDAPRLNSYYIPELETRVYSTSAYDIVDVAKMLDLHYEDKMTINPNMAYRIDVLTGDLIESVKTWKAKVIHPKLIGPSIVHAEGNFDDMAFWNKWLKGRV